MHRFRIRLAEGVFVVLLASKLAQAVSSVPSAKLQRWDSAGGI
jgi:hypothetical protein